MNESETMQGYDAFVNLFNTLQKLKNMKKRPTETVEQYGVRIAHVGAECDKVGSIFDTKMREQKFNKEERDRFIIEKFLEGLETEVKKYMYPAKRYKDVQKAMKHADKVMKKVIKQVTVTRVTVTNALTIRSRRE